jgi:hypothetical protein
MADVPRIHVETAREQVRSGRALLVCAYDDEDKCSRMQLDGSMNLTAFRQRVPSLAKDQPVIFFCS